MAPDTTLTEFFWHHLVGNREKAVAVVEDGRCLGLMRIEELQAVPADRWDHEVVRDHQRTDFPMAMPDMTIRDALALMEDADVDLLPVVDASGFVGIVTTAEILKLDEILGETGSGE